jgi:hypothetical protein
MNFKEYWNKHGSCDYDEMVAASDAFRFQEKRIPKFRQVGKGKPPKPETQVIVRRKATDEQLSIDSEYNEIIFAAIDPDRPGVWYDWESDKDIDARYFEIVEWMPIDFLNPTKAE